MCFTPSRSSASTRMSQPFIGWPISARSVFFFDFVIVLMFPFGFGLVVEINKKPTTVSSRGFLSKVALSATRPSGIAIYDDYPGYDNFQRDRIHCGENKTLKTNGQAR